VSQQEPPKIEFPCAYSIRVVGVASPTFATEVTEIVAQHDAAIDRSKVVTRDSKKGNFLSVHLVIEAQGEAHLSALYEDLKKHPSVRMVI
jgi:putative lipoic acid-binding regulatory protein